NDVDQFWQQLYQRVVVTRRSEIFFDGMEIPQRGIGCVVSAFVLALWEHVGDQAIFDVVREGAKNITGFEMASRREAEPLEADHGVASPIREPVIARNDCADIITRGVRPGGVSYPCAWRDDELISRKNQLGRPARFQFVACNFKQLSASCPLTLNGFGRIQ